MDSLPRAVTLPRPMPLMERVRTRSSDVIDVSMQYRTYAGKPYGNPAAPLSVITRANVCWRADKPFGTLDLRVTLRPAVICK